MVLVLVKDSNPGMIVCLLLFQVRNTDLLERVCYGLCLWYLLYCVICFVISSLSFFLVFDRLSNDVVHVRHWWFRRGGTFIRTLPVFNVQLIVGSVAFGIKSSWISPPADDQTCLT